MEQEISIKMPRPKAFRRRRLNLESTAAAEKASREKKARFHRKLIPLTKKSNNNPNENFLLYFGYLLKLFCLYWKERLMSWFLIFYIFKCLLGGYIGIFLFLYTVALVPRYTAVELN